MPIIPIERVLSVNSADPAYPAENILKSDSRRWRCKLGEKQASVILQLKGETIIDGIDIGNENSAFVEVLVAKSSSHTQDFKVLLVASIMMTLKEAKDGTNTNGVRFFKKDNFYKPTVDLNEKWDRVKIVCTQPFNRHVQYGLSFVVLHSPNDQVEGESSSSLGRFTLKQEEEVDQPMSVGSWFAKRKDPAPPVPPGAAASIREASSPAGIAKGKNIKPTPKKRTPKPKNTLPKNGVLKTPKAETPSRKDSPRAQKPVASLNDSIGDEDSPADDTDADSTYSPTKDGTSVLSDDDVMPDDDDESDGGDVRPKRIKKERKMLNGILSKRKGDSSDLNSSKVKVAKVNKTQKTKPFGKLLEGVTIVISGYQNPLRGELRSKACDMGARYKADWDNTCTHLICAFVNTPKFNQVRGRGKIVKKDWVVECHNRRKRLPWRRFALDKNDAGASSEDEVWEEGSIPSSSGASANANSTIASGVNRRRVSSGSGSDTEEEIERVRAKQAANKLGATSEVKTKAVQPKKQDMPSVSTMNKDPFDVDTDVDSGSESQTSHLPLPPLPDFFSNIVFHIAPDVEEAERSQLKRYITAYKGGVTDNIDGNVEYVITKLPDIAAEVGEEYGISAVKPEWIWECSNTEQLVPVSEFTL